MSNLCSYFVAIDKFSFLIAVHILELPVPEFKHNDQTFSNCLLLHRLLVTGGGEEELLRTKQKLSSILSHTCTYTCEYTEFLSEVSEITNKVGIPAFLLLYCSSPGDCLAPGCRLQLCLDSKSNP